MRSKQVGHGVPEGRGRCSSLIAAGLQVGRLGCSPHERELMGGWSGLIGALEVGRRWGEGGVWRGLLGSDWVNSGSGEGNAAMGAANCIEPG